MLEAVCQETASKHPVLAKVYIYHCHATVFSWTIIKLLFNNRVGNDLTHSTRFIYWASTLCQTLFWALEIHQRTRETKVLSWWNLYSSDLRDENSLHLKKKNLLKYGWFTVLLVSSIQQSDSIIHTYYIYICLFHYRLLQDIKYGSLCYTVGPCCLCFLIDVTLLPPTGEVTYLHHTAIL